MRFTFTLAKRIWWFAESTRPSSKCTGSLKICFLAFVVNRHSHSSKLCIWLAVEEPVSLNAVRISSTTSILLLKCQKYSSARCSEALSDFKKWMDMDSKMVRFSNHLLRRPLGWTEWTTSLNPQDRDQAQNWAESAQPPAPPNRTISASTTNNTGAPNSYESDPANV